MTHCIEVTSSEKAAVIAGNAILTALSREPSSALRLATTTEHVRIDGGVYLSLGALPIAGREY